MEYPIIGTDEAGKGDYFGPLVCAACCIDKNNLLELHDLDIRDSKKISDNKVREIAAALRRRIQYSTVIIGPRRYNELYGKLRNLNRLLAWAHARAIENLLEKVSCAVAITDKFGDERFVADALMTNGRKIRLIQVTKAERYLPVAAASIIARNEFISRMAELSKRFELKFPYGAGAPVDAIIKLFVEKFGEDNLSEVAKLHFRNTRKVLG